MVNTMDPQLIMTALGLPFRQKDQWPFDAVGGDRSTELEIGFCTSFVY
jgi:hypothetical protein